MPLNSFPLAFQVLSTYFIPKLISTIFVGLMVVFVLIASAKFVNRDTFQYLGYYNNIVSTRTYFAGIKYFKENK